MKVLSVKQPFAAMLCAGLKDVENRTWTTDFRGRLLIHASGDAYAWPDFDLLPKPVQTAIKACIDSDGTWHPERADSHVKAYKAMYDIAINFYDIADGDFSTPDELNKLIKAAAKKRGCCMLAQAIIGEADLYEVALDSRSPFAEEGCYHWCFKNPVLYKHPVLNILGHLRLWNYDQPLDTEAIVL